METSRMRLLKYSCSSLKIFIKILILSYKHFIFSIIHSIHLFYTYLLRFIYVPGPNVADTLLNKIQCKPINTGGQTLRSM